MKVYFVLSKIAERAYLGLKSFSLYVNRLKLSLWGIDYGENVCALGPLRIRMTRDAKIIIGHNKGWKQEVNLGNKTNQNFVQIPFNMLINQLQYKSQKYTDLTVEIVEESYTSKIDHLALEKLEHQENYLGMRIKRGLFRSSTNKVLNADINGAIGILRKGNAISDAQLISLRNRGDVVSPKQFILNV